MSLEQTNGKIIFLRIHDIGTGYGPEHDQIDVEAVIRLNSGPMAFGLQLRNNNSSVAQRGMLHVIQLAYDQQYNVAISFERDSTDNNNGYIKKVSPSFAFDPRQGLFGVFARIADVIRRALYID